MPLSSVFRRPRPRCRCRAALLAVLAAILLLPCLAFAQRYERLPVRKLDERRLLEMPNGQALLDR
ncbi:hypothetical protein FJ250_08865, partial [bacterium]|nr:hypothetical protein [bacterium]